MGGKQEGGGPVHHTPSAKRDKGRGGEGGILCQKKTTRVMNIRLHDNNERKGLFHEMEWGDNVKDLCLNKTKVGVEGVRSVLYNKMEQIVKKESGFCCIHCRLRTRWHN